VSAPSPIVAAAAAKKRTGRPKGAGDEDGINQRKNRKQGNGVEGARMAPNAWPSQEMMTYNALPPGASAKQGFAYQFDPKGDTWRRMDHETDISQQMRKEEKEVVSAVATVLSDLCGPGEWMPMSKLHSELLEHYSGIWHQNRIRKFLTSDDWTAAESKRRPWVGLLELLRKNPEHFVINTRSKGRMTAEFVSLVSLLS